jgi:hypothetical protein
VDRGGTKVCFLSFFRCQLVAYHTSSCQYRFLLHARATRTAMLAAIVSTIAHNPVLLLLLLRI